MAVEVQYISNLNAIQTAVKSEVLRICEIIGGMAETFAKQLCPVDTGNLRNSITHTSEDDGQTVVIGTNIVYAPYVEFGTGIYAEQGGRQTPWFYQDSHGDWHKTSGMRPRPFLRPAIENHREDYKAVFEQMKV